MINFIAALSNETTSTNIFILMQWHLTDVALKLNPLLTTLDCALALLAMFNHVFGI